MRKVKSILLAAFLAIATLPCIAQSFEYINPLNSNHTVAIQINPAFVAGGDRASTATFCKPADKFVCVKSDWFNFAVPLGRLQPKARWSHEGHQYALVASAKKHLLGKEYDILIIESLQAERKFTYTYSPKYGLIGFGAEIDGGNVFFLSGRAIGFGAQ